LCEPNLCEPNLCEPTLCEPNFCEPNLYEPGSRDFPVNFDFRFTFFQSSHISREPVNLGSHITHAPKQLLKRKFNPI
jgi:hypothetical protein